MMMKGYRMIFPIGSGDCARRSRCGHVSLSFPAQRPHEGIPAASRIDSSGNNRSAVHAGRWMVRVLHTESRTRMRSADAEVSGLPRRRRRVECNVGDVLYLPAKLRCCSRGGDGPRGSLAPLKG